MSSFDWTTIGTIASTVALVMGGFLWLATRLFSLGKAAQRLDSIDTDLSAFKQDVNSQFKTVHQEVNAVGNRLDQRMDKLILTISEVYSKQ